MAGSVSRRLTPARRGLWPFRSRNARSRKAPRGAFFLMPPRHRRRRFRRAPRPPRRVPLPCRRARAGRSKPHGRGFLMLPRQMQALRCRIFFLRQAMAVPPNQLNWLLVIVRRGISAGRLPKAAGPEFGAVRGAASSSRADDLANRTESTPHGAAELNRDHPGHLGDIRQAAIRIDAERSCDRTRRAGVDTPRTCRTTCLGACREPAPRS